MAILKRLLYIFVFPLTVIAQPDSSTLAIDMDVLQTEDLNQNLLLNDAILTSVSRLPNELGDIPFTAYIITEEQIERRGYATLVDVLKDLPGIKVSQPGSALHGETFLMRGMFGNYYVKILVDDLPIQPSVSSGTPIAAQLPVAQAERIEVLYGPAAAAYGADAMAGVINIKTKQADKLQFVDAEGSIGLPGNYRFDATIGGRFGQKNKVWNYMFYGGINHFNNMPITGGAYDSVYDPSLYAPNGDADVYLGSDYYKGTENLPAFSQLPQQSEKFGFRFGHKKLTVGLDFGRREVHAAIGSNPLYRAYHNPNTRFGDQLVRLFGAYRTSFGQWNSITNIQLLSYRIDPASSYITIVNPTNVFQGQYYNYGASQDAYVEQFLSRGFGKQWTLLTGLTFQYSSNFAQFDYFSEPFDPAGFSFFNNSAPEEYAYLDSLGVGPQNFYNLGALVDASYQSKKWEVLIGIRADKREFFNPVLSPSAGVVFKMNKNNRFRLKTSNAFRPPSTYLITNGVIYFEELDTAGIGLPHPNRNLKPEVLTNIDVGWWHQFNPRHKIDVSAFYFVNQNQITRTSTEIFAGGKLRPYYGFVNGENARSMLFGAQVHYLSEWGIGSTTLRSDFSVQYTTGQEQLPFDRGTIKHYRGQPSWHGKWLIEWSVTKQFWVMLRVHGFSEWRTRSVVSQTVQDVLVAPAGYVADLQVSYSFFNGISVYALVNNLTNSYYYGIGATGGAGMLNERLVYQDLIYNPQLLRVVKFGARIKL